VHNEPPSKEVWRHRSPLHLNSATLLGYSRSESLFGDHHMHGPEGVRFYTKLKTITTRWPTGIRSGADFVVPTMR